MLYIYWSCCFTKGKEKALKDTLDLPYLLMETPLKRKLDKLKRHYLKDERFKEIAASLDVKYSRGIYFMEKGFNMKGIFKGLLLCIFIVVLTSCGKAKCVEKEITLPKEIKKLSRVYYFGEDIYQAQMSTIGSYLFNTNGNLVIKERIIESIKDTSFSKEGSICVAKPNSKFMLINKDGKILNENYQFYHYVGKGIFFCTNFMKDECYCDSKGNVIVKSKKWQYVILSKDPNFLPCRHENGKYGCINSEKKTVLPFEFDDINIPFKDIDLISVCKNKKWGVINKKGKSIIPYKYDYCSVLEDGAIIVTVNKLSGLIDKNNKVLIPIKFNYITYIKNNLYKVTIDNHLKDNFFMTGIVNNKGAYIVKPIDNFNSSYIDDKNLVNDLVDKNGVSLYKGEMQHQLLDTKGRILSKESYDEIEYYKNDLFRIKKNNKYGFMNRQGKIIVPVKYNNKLEFNNDFCIVNLNGKYGVLDKTNHYKINPKYENVKYISKGYFAVKLNNKWGIVDSHDKIVKPIEYDDISGIESKIKCDYNVIMKKENKGLLLKLE